MTGMAIAILVFLAKWAGRMGGALPLLARTAIRQPWFFLTALALSGGAWEKHRADAALKALNACQVQTAQMRKASQRAMKEAIARNQSLKRQSQEAANAAQQFHAALLDHRASLDAYIRAHRMQPGAPRNPSRKLSTTTDTGDTAFSANPAAATPLAINPTVLKICDADYAYALSAYRWASALAPPPPLLKTGLINPTPITELRK